MSIFNLQFRPREILLINYWDCRSMPSSGVFIEIRHFGGLKKVQFLKNWHLAEGLWIEFKIV